jgi:hypothetical protein
MPGRKGQTCSKNLTGIASPAAIYPLPSADMGQSARLQTPGASQHKAKIYNISLMVGQTNLNSPDFPTNAYKL